MIIDSSVIIAVVVREPRHETLLDRIAAADQAGIGAPTVAETGIVLEARFGLDAHSILDRFLGELDIAVVTFGPPHWRESVSAYRRYGKGRHPAALNFGDCMSYAVARLADQPLLYVGDDFAKTDVEAV